MSAEIAERQQVEELKDWWRAHGVNLVLCLALGIAGVFGWRYWQNEQTQQAEAASMLYSTMLTTLDANAPDTARDMANKVLAQYQDTGYAVFALLTLARLAVEEEDLYAAEGYLRRALDGSKDDSIAHIIRLRLARVLIGQDNPEQAEALLKDEQPGEFASAYDELLADVRVLQGRPEAAQTLYRESVSKGRANGQDVAVPELKLENLGEPERAPDASQETP